MVWIAIFTWGVIVYLAVTLDRQAKALNAMSQRVHELERALTERG